MFAVIESGPATLDFCSQDELRATVTNMNAVLNNCAEYSPYRLENEQAYRDWRRRKLELRAQAMPLRMFELDAEGLLPQEDLIDAQRQVEAFNFVLFRAPRNDLDKRGFLRLNRQFGLNDLDDNPGADGDQVTSLHVVDGEDPRALYIPYTNRAMNWHTDGYYNPRHRRVNAFALYCVRQAARGGGNFLFDHEMMYLLLRDHAPQQLEALMAEDMMLIPANIQDGRVVRAEESGPVFSLQPPSCALNMRYTSRPRNIVWKSDRRSQDALNRVRQILVEGNCVIGLQLQPGEGVICNNLLHGREAFQDDPQRPARLVYRARYYDAIDLQRRAGLERPA